MAPSIGLMVDHLKEIRQESAYLRFASESRSCVRNWLSQPVSLSFWKIFADRVSSLRGRTVPL